MPPRTSVPELASAGCRIIFGHPATEPMGVEVGSVVIGPAFCSKYTPCHADFAMGIVCQFDLTMGPVNGSVWQIESQPAGRTIWPPPQRHHTLLWFSP